MGTVVKGLGISQRVIIQEYTRGYVERDEDIDAVVFMCGQDEKDTKDVQKPTYCVKE